MKNHFYISYSGNKRNEIESIYNKLDFENIDTIVEPFCGSCAMSYYISTKKQGLKYILNDNNKYLLEMYKIIKNDTKLKKLEDDFNKACIKIKNNKEEYLKIIKEDNIVGWLISHKIYYIRPGLFPLNNKYKETINFKDFPIYNFFRNENIEFYNNDAILIYEKYKNKNNCMLLLDPPYISCCNDFYINSNMNIYEYLCKNNINKEQAKIYLILENIWIIKLLFQTNKILFEYNKTYEMSKKKTTHILITQ